MKLSPALVSQLEATDIALNLEGGEAGITLAFAVSTIDAYVTEAAVQHARMQRTRMAIQRHLRRLSGGDADGSGRPWPRRRASQVSLFRSAHFYLICWRMVSRHLTLIRDVCRLPHVGRALRRYAQTLRAYEVMRDHYEHFDERLPGRKNAGRLTKLHDLGNILGDTLTFGGERVDVGPKSLRLMKRMVEDVLGAFKIAAIQTIAAKTPERLHGLFMPIRARRVEREIRRVMQRLQPLATGGSASR